MKAKAKVSRQALLARVRRQLSKVGQQILACRPDSQWYSELGPHYLVDLSSGLVVRSKVDLADFAAELGSLKTFERVAV